MPHDGSMKSAQNPQLLRASQISPAPLMNYKNTQTELTLSKKWKNQLAIGSIKIWLTFNVDIFICTRLTFAISIYKAYRWIFFCSTRIYRMCYLLCIVVKTFSKQWEWKIYKKFPQIKNVERETSPNKLVRILHLNEVNMSLGSEATDRG